MSILPDSAVIECGCTTHDDYDGEIITRHCNNHCPKVGRKWEDMTIPQREYMTRIGVTKAMYEWTECRGC